MKSAAVTFIAFSFFAWNSVSFAADSRAALKENPKFAACAALVESQYARPFKTPVSLFDLEKLKAGEIAVNKKDSKLSIRTQTWLKKPTKDYNLTAFIYGGHYAEVSARYKNEMLSELEMKTRSQSDGKVHLTKLEFGVDADGNCKLVSRVREVDGVRDEPEETAVSTKPSSGRPASSGVAR